MQNNLLKNLRLLSPLSTLAVLTALCMGLWDAAHSSSLESALALWALGLAVLLPGLLSENARSPYPKTAVRIASGIILLSSFFFSQQGYINVTAALLVLSCALFFGNFGMTKYAIIPVLIWMLAVPNCEHLHQYVSYPMRVMGAKAAAEILWIFGISASASGTMMTIDGVEIAITTACSGIEQLESMLLVGWICVTFMHRNTLVKIVHFSTILPIILFANILRLVITLWGAHSYGDVFLSDEVHTGLGIATVAVVIVIFIGVGEIFGRKEAAE